MPALVGYLVAAVVTVAISLVLAGPRHTVRRDPTFDLTDVAGRHVTILGALAGFAVTGIVLLVTQSRTLPAESTEAFTTVLVMFVVAYMGYWSSSALYANVSHEAVDPPFDLAAAQYAGASITLFTLLLGWFALKPLFEAFGLAEVASITGWLLVAAVVVSYASLATSLSRSGYASIRQVVAIAVLGILAAAAQVVAMAVLGPVERGASARLLTLLAFGGALPAYAAFALLPVIARHERAARVLAQRWHLAVIGYAQAATVLIAFLLLAVLDLT